MDAEMLAKRLERAKAEIKGLEQLIESKTRDLFLSRESLRKAAEFQEKVFASMASALLVLDPQGRITQANQMAAQLLGHESVDALIGLDFSTLASFPDSCQEAPYLCENQEIEITTQQGEVLPCHFSGSAMKDADDQLEAYVCVWLDLSDKRQMEIELRHAQKLESLGQMAAGVAHEINTPIQFVGDSLSFLQEAFQDLRELLHRYQESKGTWGQDEAMAELAASLETAEEETDIEFIDEEAPGAFERATNGLARVATIVKALKSFSHPGSEEVSPNDLNEVIRTTLTLANNEVKYVAELETDLADMPEVPCHPGDMGQVFLNLIVNAAHAVGDKIEATGGIGKLRISSRVEGDNAVYEVQDNGGGIPEDIRERIFDPFFTTKEVGRGTGQGLAISRRIVVEKHQGRLEVETESGVGTTFRITLPLHRQRLAA